MPEKHPFIKQEEPSNENNSNNQTEIATQKNKPKTAFQQYYEKRSEELRLKIEQEKQLAAQKAEAEKIQQQNNLNNYGRFFEEEPKELIEKMTTAQKIVALDKAIESNKIKIEEVIDCLKKLNEQEVEEGIKNVLCTSMNRIRALSIYQAYSNEEVGFAQRTATAFKSILNTLPTFQAMELVKEYIVFYEKGSQDLAALDIANIFVQIIKNQQIKSTLPQALMFSINLMYGLISPVALAELDQLKNQHDLKS